MAASFWLGSRVEVGIPDTGREVDFNTLGYIVGCFVNIGVLYRFLKADGKARATRRYSEWRLCGATKTVPTTVHANAVMALALQRRCPGSRKPSAGPRTGKRQR
ncbi:hypothetical protein [Candidatus Poriferisodalis sp.]|uniref:hypothetical protein n=1 Tax=Candidatus Poriferisodalis sp. TaxID=3101277 RepID=UPI003AF9BE7B